MGIPRLNATLQPYSDCRALKDEAVVIDGPALAYHILHVCRINDVAQPSYRLVTLSTLAWLNELSKHEVAVQAIYFDGHLPASKHAVRMERARRNFTRISRLFSENPLGCPRDQIAAVDRRHQDLNFFRAVVPGTIPCADPSFFVPAFIDALRYDCRYRDLVQLVPGEADAFCARHVSTHGGLVLTSDSDLLYDLGAVMVAFFRDLHRDAVSTIRCTSFSLRLICERLHLSSSVRLLRLAYELRDAPSATLPQLLRACEQPVAMMPDYEEFCEQYRLESCILNHETFSQLSGLDPRLSELIVQLFSPLDQLNMNHSVAKVFLPDLIEKLDRDSAWQQSTPIRRLAYTLAGLGSSRPSMPTLEYRRVQNVGQNGRLIEAASAAEARQCIDEVLDVIKSVKDIKRAPSKFHWTLTALSLDMGECKRQSKQSHVWHLFQQRHRQALARPDKIAWDVVHFFAQLQAAMYSLRMLQQVLSTFHKQADKNPLVNVNQLWAVMRHFPPLAIFPDIDDALELLDLGQNGLAQDLDEVIRLQMPLSPRTDHRGKVAKRAKGKGTRKEPPGVVRKLATKPEDWSRTNKFSPLSLD